MKLLTPILLLTSAGLASAAVNGPYTPDANTLHLWHFDEALVGASPYNNSSRLFPVDVLDSTWRLDDGYYDTTYQSGIMGGTGYTGFGGAGQLDHAGGNGLNANHNEFRKGLSTDGSYPLPGEDGNTGTITATQLLGSTSGAFTIDGMIKWNGSQGGGTEGWIFKTGPDGSADFRLTMQNAGTTPVFRLGLPNTGGSNTFTTTAGLVPALTTTDWYHFALTFDGNNEGGSPLKFYWTNVEESATEATLVQTFNSTGNTAYNINGAFHVGDWSANNFDGQVDEFRISNVARGSGDFIFAAAAPEPSATLSFLLGAAGLLMRRRRA